MENQSFHLYKNMNPTSISNYVQNTSDVLLAALSRLLNTFAGYLPSILGALVILFFGLLVAKMLRNATKRIVKWTRLPKLMSETKLDESLAKTGIKKEISDILATIVYWIIVLIFLSAMFETLGLQVVVSTFNQLIAYLPNLIVAVITLVLALIVSRFVKSLVVASLEKLNISYAQIVAVIAESLVVLFGASIAASQLGLDVSIVTANIAIIVMGAVALAVIVLGFGSKTAGANIISGYYTKQLYKKGDKVSLAGHKGTVKEINNMAVILESNDGTVVVPNEEALKKGSVK